LPQISIVIPVYNGEETIFEAVSSVLTQTFQDFELIVIDDGSRDSTPEILGSIDDSRLEVFTYPNAGLSASRNRGIALACGDFISFLDADDFWTTDKLEAQLNALRETPDAAVSYSWTDFIDDKGKRLGYGIHHTANGYVFPDLLVFFFVGSGSNALIRRDVFDQVGGFDESLVSAEDWDMFLRLAARHHFVAVPRAQILYRVVEDSMSGNVLRQERECLKVIESAFSREPGKSLQHLRRYSYSKLYLYLSGRVLRGTPSRQNGLLAARFLWRSFHYDPRILKQPSSVFTLVFKILTAIVLTPKRAQAFRATVKSLVQRAPKATYYNQANK
jgi:glycosyltransferase involved in cell wall biosynthesis